MVRLKLREGVAFWPKYAKANNLRLEDYIEHLLTVLPERLADDPDADIDDLLPWADGMQKSFAMTWTGV